MVSDDCVQFWKCTGLKETINVKKGGKGRRRGKRKEYNKRVKEKHQATTIDEVNKSDASERSNQM